MLILNGTVQQINKKITPNLAGNAGTPQLNIYGVEILMKKPTLMAVIGIDSTLTLQK